MGRHSQRRKKEGDGDDNEAVTRKTLVTALAAAAVRIGVEELWHRVTELLDWHPFCTTPVL